MKSEDTIQSLIEAIAAHNPDADFALVRKAYAWAASGLDGQRLRNGAPALSRPLAAAHILTRLRVDETVIAAGLLYDAVLNGDAADPGIRKEFGNDVADIAAAVANIEWRRAKYASKPRVEDIRMQHLAMCEDIRALLIALADRLHTMRSLEGQSQPRRMRIARETRELHVPLVKLLALSGFEEELNDLCFRHLHAEEYGPIDQWLAKRKSSDEAYIRETVEALGGILDTALVRAALTGKIKRVHSIFEEMAARDVGLDAISATTFTVVVQDETTCYQTLGAVHGAWRPIPGTFEDKLMAPCDMMNRSLQTTVIGPRGERMEVRIRSEAMALEAERGLLSHWWNEAGARIDPGDAERLGRLRILLDLEDGPPPDPLFWEQFNDVMYVFTPDGALKYLPKGSTPLDFAYAIHTEVGNTCVGAKVNGRLMPLSTQLRRGDIVAILTSRNGRPSREWLAFVKTGKARRKIGRRIRELESARATPPDGRPDGTESTR